MSAFEDFGGQCVQDVFKVLVHSISTYGQETSPRGIKSKEIIAPRIEIEDPRKRWITFKSRRMDIAYALGELFWYLHKTDSLEPIEYYAPSIREYSDDGKTLNSAYGYLIFMRWGDQIHQVIHQLTKDPDSRQAIIFMRSPDELWKETKDSVCTNTLQFFIREKKLHMVTNMRSNDLFVGFMYDCFCFTMLQEIIAIRLDVDVGKYIHIPGSLHIYEQWYEYCSLIWEEKNIYWDMGRMTVDGADVEGFISELCRQEELIRTAPDIDALEHVAARMVEIFPDYWKQIFYLLVGVKAIKLNYLELDFYKQLNYKLLDYQNWYFVEYMEHKLRKLASE